MSSTPKQRTSYKVLNYARWRHQWLDKWVSNQKENRDFSSLEDSIPPYLDKIGIKTVIQQTEYLDLDFEAAFARFYCFSFRPPDKYCIRCLFFNREFSTIGQLDDEIAKKAFCGFITVWPTSPEVIGSTVLPFPSFDDGTTHSVSAKYIVHIAGKTLETSQPSAMFASKDHGVSVCASIATWLATDLLHRRYDLDTCSSSEITLLATGVDPKWGRPFPQAAGLDNGQIIKALHSLDYGPVVYCYDNSSGWPLETDGMGNPDNNWIGPLYGYICSKLPVIIICSVKGKQHAVLAIGLHTKNTNEPDPNREESLAMTFTRLVDKIIVHDDRGGVYSTLEKNPSTGHWVLTPSGLVTELAENIEVLDLIVPLPQNVVLTSRYAHALGIVTLTPLINAKFKPLYRGPFRTTLKRSIDFKEESHSWPKNMMEMARYFQSVPMPRWIWVTEAFEEGTTIPNNHNAFARAVLDSTQLRFDKNRLLLAYHVYDTFQRGDEINPD